MKGDNHGLITLAPEPGHFVFGGNQLNDAPIMPDGNWTPWLPIGEYQNINGVEPDACVSFAVLNCVETLILQEYGEKQNLSDRWLAWAAGTALRHGNDPQTVCETLRKKGDVPEDNWTIDGAVRDYASFYATPPQALSILALDFIDEFAYGHEWVSATPKDMMAALAFSPLSAGVYAWQLDPSTGLYISPTGSIQEHEAMIYNYEEGKCWYAFDSYGPDTKKLAWDFAFVGVKRHTIRRQIVDNSAWGRFLKTIRRTLGL